MDVRVHLETVPTVSRRGEDGVKRRWVAERDGVVGRGQTIKAATADLRRRARA